MAKRKKIVVCGQLGRAVAYPMQLPTDGQLARREKTKTSSAARARMNLKTSAQKLRQMIACNFRLADLVVTLSYDDRHRPETKKDANKLLKRFLTKLRNTRRADGRPLAYIYTTEKWSAEGQKVHHHLIVNAVGGDFATIRKLWTYGTDVEIQTLSYWGIGFEAIAEYLTKEPREHGKPEVGARTWTPSIGLKKPKEDNGYLKDGETLEEPYGAIILTREEKRTPYGTYLYIEYWVPKPGDLEAVNGPPTIT